LGHCIQPTKSGVVFKTTDGGKTWQQTLFINETTGVIDLLINPANPDQMWAASWERSRKAWEFDEDGEGSSIYISTDGGLTWTQSVTGFPQGPKVGRIGLSLCKTQPNILYALLDNQEEYEKEEEKGKEDSSMISFDILRTISNEDFMVLEDSIIDKFLKDNKFPEKYSAKVVKNEIRENKYGPKAIGNYYEDANDALFNTNVLGAEVYRSVDGGKTWNKVNSYRLEGVYYTYGYYFGEVRVDPVDPDKIFIFGVPFLMSADGGKTYNRLDTTKVHVDHHALWINEDDPQHLILGNDGGLYISYDGGGNFLHLNNLAVGQFYTVAVDMEKPYNVYGGLQDNGVLKGSSMSVPNESEHWKWIGWGDGMYINIEPENSNIYYTGYQFGHYWRYNNARGEHKKITPKHDIGAEKYRFNWRTPLKMSTHNSGILYIGAQKLLRTLDKGNSWEEISPDLTTNRSQENVPYSTITTISESPLKFGLIWVGTDDGNVWVTRNGGATWKLVSSKLPKSKWVSKIDASPHDMAVAYLSLTGYRDDDFTTYIYKTTDYGKTWRSLKSDLPNEAVNIILQDQVNPELLYLGTDHSTYISMDDGTNWHRMNRLPNVASYDMVIHPRDGELVIATHGRSMYVMDIKPLRKLIDGNINNSIIAFAPKKITFSEKWGEKRYPYLKANNPSTVIMYYVGKLEPGAKEVELTISNSKGEIIKNLKTSNEPGFHYIKWDLIPDGEQLGTDDNKEKPNFIGIGTYTLKFLHGDSSDEVQLILK